MDDDVDYEDLGGDIYGTSNLHFGTTSTTFAPQFLQAPGVQNDEESDKGVAELEDMIAAAVLEKQKLQETLESATAQAAQWQRAYQELQLSYPELVKKAGRAEALLKSKEAGELQSGQAQLYQRLSEEHQDNLAMRHVLHEGRCGANPQIAQLRQLLLDPAVCKEFKRVCALLEERDGQIPALKEASEATPGTAHSHSGHMLVARIRELKAENDAYAAKLAASEEEQRLLLTRNYAEDMHRVYRQLEDYASTLDEESEELSLQVFHLRKRLRETEGREAGGGSRPGPSFGAGDHWGNRPRFPGRGSWGNRGPGRGMGRSGGPPRGDPGPKVPRSADRQQPPPLKRPR